MHRLPPVLMMASLAGMATPSAAFDDDSLTIWMGPNKGSDLISEVSKQFTDDLGIDVKVVEVDPLPDKFQQAAATGDGPDIVMWAHDRFGEWSDGGLIQPLSPSDEFTDGIIDTAADAVQFGGKTWGYPVSVEAVSLIYNKSLLESPPASFEEITELDLGEGVAPIMWDYNNTYFTFPLMMANGGFAFEKVDGAYDGSRTGVNTEGAIRGGEVLKSLIDSGTMPKGVDYGVMDGAMNKGEVAMVLNGPWAWANLQSSGIDFGVAPIPTVNGKPSPSFVGVFSAAINAASPNADLAIELLEGYLLTDEGLEVWNSNNDLGALADVSAAAMSNDPNVAAMLENAAGGVPMPSNPEMGAFWSAMEPALGNITTGAQDVETALNDAAKRIAGE